MNITKLFLEVPLPVNASYSHDNVEVRIDREQRGLVSITILGCIREVSIDGEDEQSAYDAACDMLDRCWLSFKPTRRCPRAAFALCTGSEIRDYADMIRKVAGV